jgi:general secretion pathway protein D
MKLNVLIVSACVLLTLLVVPGEGVQAQSQAAAQGDGIPAAQLISSIAKKTGKRFLIDPRLRADVLLIGQDPASLDYAGLLSTLNIHGFAAVEQGGYVLIVPDAGIRSLPLPLVTGKEAHPEAEHVSKIISVKNVSAVQLVPLLRPLLPQQAHLAALPCTNVLIIADTFGNVKRIEKLVQTLDTGEPYTPEKCGTREPAPQRSM